MKIQEIERIRLSVLNENATVIQKHWRKHLAHKEALRLLEDDANKSVKSDVSVRYFRPKWSMEKFGSRNRSPSLPIAISIFERQTEIVLPHSVPTLLYFSLLPILLYGLAIFSP